MTEQGHDLTLNLTCTFYLGNINKTLPYTDKIFSLIYVSQEENLLLYKKKKMIFSEPQVKDLSLKHFGLQKNEYSTNTFKVKK